MGSKIKLVFRVIKQMNRHSRKALTLSALALILVTALLVGSTYSWVESVSSIMIHTTGQTVAGGTKGVINNPLNQRASVSSSGNAIDLTTYVRQSGDFHMTAASSADGNTICFPETRKTSGEQSTNYRIGTINDRNVNYICFTFKVTSNNSFAFDEVPVIKLGGTVVSDNLVRVAFGVNGEFNVYGKTAASEVVPTGTGVTASTSVHAFSEYVKGKNRLFTTTGGSTFVTVSIWVQDPTFAKYSSYNNKQFTIEKFKLVPVSPFTAKAVYVVNGVKTLGGAGGTVAINDGDFGATATAYVASGQQVTIKATANDTNGYGFLGWATTQTAQSATDMNIVQKSGCTTVNKISSYTYTIGNIDTIFAHFSDEHVLYLSPGYQHFEIPNSGSTGRYAAYLWGNVNGVLKKEWYVMDWDQSHSKYKLTYKGSANSVIFCYMNPNQTYNNEDLNANNGAAGWTYKYLQTFDLSFPQEVGDYTYVTTSRRVAAQANEGDTLTNDNSSLFGSDKLFGYWDSAGLYATATAAVDGTGGTVTAKLASSTSSNSTVTRYQTSSTTVKMDPRAYQDSNDANIKYEKKVILNAVADQTHDFEGWYLNETKVAATASATVELPDNSSGTVTYKAKFVLKPETTTNIYVSPRNGWDHYYIRAYQGSSILTTGTNGFQEADYDSATGYYKISFTTRLVGSFYCALASDLSWSNQVPGSSSAGYEGAISNSYLFESGTPGSLTAWDSNMRCVWFIDNTSDGWLKTDWNKTDGGKTIMRVSYDSTSVSDAGFMTRKDDGAWIYEFNQATNTSSYFYFYEVYDNSNAYAANKWRTTFAVNKTQYKASGGAGHDSWGSGTTG